MSAMPETPRSVYVALARLFQEAHFEKESRLRATSRSGVDACSLYTHDTNGGWFS